LPKEIPSNVEKNPSIIAKYVENMKPTIVAELVRLIISL
jgi:hypothetical protein